MWRAAKYQRKNEGRQSNNSVNRGKGQLSKVSRKNGEIACTQKYFSLNETSALVPDVPDVDNWETQLPTISIPLIRY